MSFQVWGRFSPPLKRTQPVPGGRPSCETLGRSVLQHRPAAVFIRFPKQAGLAGQLCSSLQVPVHATQTGLSGKGLS